MSILVAITYPGNARCQRCTILAYLAQPSHVKDRKFEGQRNSKVAKKIREIMAQCNKNCWMIGSVAPMMFEKVWMPTLWIIKQQLMLLLGQEPCLDTPKPRCPTKRKMG